MSIELYLLNIREKLESPVDEYLEYFSAERVKKILSYKFNPDRNRTVWAELLARKLISERTGKNFKEIKIFRNSDGRPYCEKNNGSEIFFSLSHSGAWAACSIGDSENGVDVENFDRKIDMNIAKRFFLPNEYEAIKNFSPSYDEQKKKFFQYWTLKESCLKCLNLKEWTGVDCEKLLSGDGEFQGENFFLDDGAVVGICARKNELPEKISIKKSPTDLLKISSEGDF